MHKLLKRLQTVLENLNNKHFNYIQLEITSNSNKLFQILKISFCYLIHIQNMIYADIGKNFNKNHSIQSFNTIKQLKDLKCIIILIQMTYSELSHKFQDS